ncbi:FusB/FusC family EF-G-binding protein [Paenibacillus sp. HB172176]|uniref:FusB/FusC family EF-G-binding protein n=1 Tax=Paenibacillus sp. HB172176 TaxID=2493690 RepID=UPI00143BF1ED|nr:FusB/FusC family EF-G-binding protein [Paenibacillus sp. HB172176]
MSQTFIKNHQYNEIKKQIGRLQKACMTVSDRKVIEAVRDETAAKISALFSDADEKGKELLGGLETLKEEADFRRYMSALEPYLAEFEPVTESGIKKLFPKIKKLKVPNLAEMDFRHMTYLGWRDIATNRLFIVYRQNGKLLGVEGKYAPSNKKGVCFACNRHAEVALYTAAAKWKPTGASSDYYRAIGNYLCVHSETCNENITNVDALETFLHGVLVGP